MGAHASQGEAQLSGPTTLLLADPLGDPVAVGELPHAKSMTEPIVNEATQ